VRRYKVTGRTAKGELITFLVEASGPAALEKLLSGILNPSVQVLQKTDVTPVDGDDYTPTGGQF
jgi:hypothetical protein